MSRDVVFSHIRTAREEARDAFVLTAILVAFGVPFVAIGWGVTSMFFGVAGGWAWLLPAPGFLFLLGGAALLLFSLFTLGVGISHRLRGGQWEVVVTDRELLWQAPGIGNASFRIPLAEVAALERVTTHSKKRVRGKVERRTGKSFRLARRDGQRVVLHPPSKSDMAAFAEVLQRAGVAVRDVAVERS